MTTTIPRNCDPSALRRRRAFGIAVRNERVALGLTQAALAERASCDRQSVNRVENGAYAPTLDAMFRLAAALGVALSDLCVAAEAALSRAERWAS